MMAPRYENAQELADKIKHADVLLAIGGGRVADTAKLLQKEWKRS